MRARTPAEDPAARAQRERDRRLAELSAADTTMGLADGLTADLRKVYGLRRLGRAGAAATPGVQPGAAPMPVVVAQAQRETAMDRQQQDAAMTMAALRNQATSPLAPATSPRPMPNPNYGSSLAPATSIRPMPNPFTSSKDTKQGQISYAPATSPRPKPNPNFSQKKNK